MITDHTDPTEAWTEFARDAGKILYFMERNRKKSAHRAADAAEYPFFETVDYISPVTKNVYKVYFRTDQETEDTVVTKAGCYLPVQQQNGKRVYMYRPEVRGQLDKDEAYLWVLNPHFQSRYRERMGVGGADNLSELIDDLSVNLPPFPLTIKNNKDINRNFLRYSGKIDDQECNRYIPMFNGIAYINEVVIPNKKSALPRNVHVIEMRTCIDNGHLTAGQRRAMQKDFIAALRKTVEKDPIRNGIDFREFFPGDSDDPFDFVKLAKEVIQKKYKGLPPMPEPAALPDALPPAPPTEGIIPNRSMRRYLDKKKAAKAKRSAKQAPPEPLPQDIDSFDDTEIADILVTRAAGLTIARIAANYKTHTDAIRKVLADNKERLDALIAEKKAEAAARKTTSTDTDMNKNFSQKKAKEMAALRKEGLTLGEIARRYDTKESIVMQTIEPYMHDKPEKDDGPVPQSSREAGETISFTDEQIVEILEQVSAGTKYSTIASRFQVTTAEISAVVAEHSVRLPEITQKQVTPEQAKPSSKAVRGPVTDDEIVSFYKGGFSVEDLAKDAGRSSEEILTILAKAAKAAETKSAPAKANRQNITEKEKDAILQMLLNGETATQISTKTGVSVWGIYRLKKKLKDMQDSDQTANTAEPVAETNPEPAAAAAAPEPEPQSWTEDDIRAMYELRKMGSSIQDIAAVTKMSEETLRLMMPEQKLPTVSVLPVRPSLDAFHPNEMLQYLYDLGYRIENGELVIIKKVTVNISDILENR